MEPPRTGGRSSAGLRGGAAIAASIGVMNLATYGFLIVAARRLGPQPFGALTALLNVLLVASVLSLALQATAARRIAREPADVDAVERTILLLGVRTAVGLGAVLLVLAPAVDALLKLDSIASALMLAGAIVPLTLMGAQAGILQGERRWIPLALVYVAIGVPRLAVGTLLLWWRPTESAAFAVVTMSAFAPVLVGQVALRRKGRSRQTGINHTASHLWWETVQNSQALLAFMALSNIDIVIARNALDGKSAGLFAAGLIVVKAVAFLPQFVVILAFPSLGSDRAPQKALLGSLGAVALTGVVVVGAVGLLPDLALVLAGGDDYAVIGGRLWVFALLGVLISVVQLLVYNVLARQNRGAVLFVWAALVALVVAGSRSDSITGLLHRELAVDAALLATLLAVSLSRLRFSPRRKAEPTILGHRRTRTDSDSPGGDP